MTYPLHQDAMVAEELSRSPLSAFFELEEEQQRRYIAGLHGQFEVCRKESRIDNEVEASKRRLQNTRASVR